MEMFLTPLLMLYIFHSLFVLQEYVQIVVASTIETHFWLALLLKKGYQYQKLCKAFYEFYRRQSELSV